MHIVLMSYEGSIKTVTFMTPWAGVLMLGRGHISHYSEYAASFTLSIYSTLIDIVLRGLWCCFHIPSLIIIYSMMGLMIYKYEPLWQELSAAQGLLMRRSNHNQTPSPQAKWRQDWSPLPSTGPYDTPVLPPAPWRCSSRLSPGITRWLSSSCLNV